MVYLIINFIVLIYAIILHEIAHGNIAYLFGDPTAKMAGRLTLNPIPHIDIIGSLLLPGLTLLSGSPIMFGWAKPVPINPGYFRQPQKEQMWVAIAGPLANISIALIASLILKLAYPALTATYTIWGEIAVTFLIGMVQINLVLAIFNLIPLPPLDGSRVLYFFASTKWRIFLDKIEPYGFIIIFALLYLKVLNPLLSFFLVPLFQAFLPAVG
jgi:Zn-dependent protease